MATATIPPLRTTTPTRTSQPARAPRPAPATGRNAPGWLASIPAPRKDTIAAIRRLGASDAEVYEAVGWLIGEHVHGRAPEPGTIVDRVRRLLRET